MSRKFQNNELCVNCGQRYAGAWAEINTRLQSRQMVNIFFTTAIIALIAFPYKNDNHPYNSTIPIMMGCVSWLFTLWIRHNDQIIGLLSCYCKSLEDIDDPLNELGLPAWHSKQQGIMSSALNARKLSDYSTIILICAAPIPALFNLSQLPGYYIVINSIISLSLSFSAASFIYQNKKIRDEILNNMEFKETNGKYCFK